VTRLGDAQRQGRLDEELRKLLWTPLLVVDEVGYIPFDPQEANLMFSLVSSRYDWLVHHAEILSLKGDSYRLRDRHLGGRPPAREPRNR
jgi:DNA replication protein DnaC